ncbi:MAG: putative toxin-antitoxin system toxin component, PIN family [Magnetococcales bacterium]|nr:putative toxin-antitoxin system toxin component, PIN family [Magnetococcales bacterium]
MHVVLDTNVLVAGLRSNQGASYQILRCIGSDGPVVTPIISVPVFLEYEAVLKRQGTFPIPWKEEKIDAVLDLLLAVSERPRLYYLWRPLLPDPGDDMIVEVAVAGKADAIVTFNIRDFVVAKERFGLKVLTPREFLKVLREKRT